jgi:general secretion pathway protein E
VGSFTPDETLQLASVETGMEILRLPEMEAMSPDFAVFSYAECLQRDCVVLLVTNSEHVGTSDTRPHPLFVCADPWNQWLISLASYRLTGYFDLAFAHPLELKALLARFGASQEALSQLIRLDQTASSADEAEEISLASIASDDSQVVRLVNSTLYDAHRDHVSDIHFENSLRGLTIKYRIDGVISTVRTLPDPTLSEQVISRLKVIAELDIGEKRVPQDARDVDFRVSIMPGLFGEDAVLRILDRQALTADMAQLNLDVLGIDDETRNTLRRLARDT